MLNIFLKYRLFSVYRTITSIKIIEKLSYSLYQRMSENDSYISVTVAETDFLCVFCDHLITGDV